MQPRLPVRIANTIMRWGKNFLAAVDPFRPTLHRVLHNERLWIVTLLIIGALLRVPFIDHPQETVFDEPIYADFAILILQEHPIFDIHPPLARMFFATLVSYTDVHTASLSIITTPDFVPHDFQEFPYAFLRIVMACIGTLLPLLIFGVARRLHVSTPWAGLAAFLALIDPALIVYARAILPDTLLLVIEFLAIYMALWALQTERPLNRFLLGLLSAILLGFALSIKWIALSIAGIVGLFYFARKAWGLIGISLIVVPIVYISIFLSFILSFPSGGNADPVLLTYDVPYVTTMQFPAHPTLGEATAFLGEMHQVMWRANTDPITSARLPESPTALSWPIAKVSMLGWWSQDHEHFIMLKGNTLLYPLTLFLFLFEIGWIVAMMMRTRRWPISTTESILCIGAIGNYLPFFLIGRSMFLYHYFTAFLFLLLLIPFILPRFMTAMHAVTRDRIFVVAFLCALLFLILHDTITALPQIYGF